MSTAPAEHPGPAMHVYETKDEMVVDVELPSDGQNLQIQVDKGVLALTVPIAHPTPRRWNNPDATPC